MPARTRESGEERVTPLELFFDLIFVFALTQVTGLVVADPTWAGLVRGLRRARRALVGMGCVCLADEHDRSRGRGRAACHVRCDGRDADRVFRRAGRIRRRCLLFACAYAIVRIAHLVLYAVAGRGDRELLAAVRQARSRQRARGGLAFRRRGARRQAAGRGLGDRAGLRPPRRRMSAGPAAGISHRATSSSGTGSS